MIIHTIIFQEFFCLLFLEWQRKKDKASYEGNLDELYKSCLELARIYNDEDEVDNALKEYKVN